jgi:hypothetical protein
MHLFANSDRILSLILSGTVRDDLVTVTYNCLLVEVPVGMFGRQIEI